MTQPANSQDDFYIGWQAEAPQSFAQHIRKKVWWLGGIILLVAGIVVLAQRGFSTSVFEFGNIVTLEGYLAFEPVPMLRMNSKKDLHGREVFQNVLLVGYGKHGAMTTIKKLERRSDVWATLENRRVKIRGTLLYHDGKTVLELTQGIQSLEEIGGVDNFFDKKEDLGERSLQGEIIDPKCYFGVMKPGHGKPHRSCAIRCISGGIPPVLKVQNELGENNYFILLGPSGKPINQYVLDYVAEPIGVCGRVKKWEDWYIVYVDLNQGFQRLGEAIPTTFCE